jgi:hypothetical protein
MNPSAIQTSRILVGRGFSTDTDGRWRLPHALYVPNKFELHCLKHLVDSKVTEGLTDEAKAELKKQLNRRWQCKIGIHSYDGWVFEYGPQTAIQMNMRSGATVVVIRGNWKTCFHCGKQKLRERPFEVEPQKLIR